MECAQCKFFQHSQNECRRYAPSPAEGDKRAHWPNVSSDDWCGEFVVEGADQRQVA